MSPPSTSRPPADRPDPDCRPAGAMLRAGRSHDRAGRLEQALGAYAEAIQLAEQTGDHQVLAEALRRKAVVHYRRGETDLGLELCQRSYDEAVARGDRTLAGEALNALGGFRMQAGELDAAGTILHDALRLAAADQALLGRIQQNLGILANIQGRHSEAMDHYRLSLQAFEEAGDERGSAIAYHNLGMIASQRGDQASAEASLSRSAVIAARIEEVHLEGLCWLNLAAVAHRMQQFGEALKRAEAALAIFEQLGCQADKAAVYKVIGMVFRDTGRPVLAEARLRTAAQIALQTKSVLTEAESSRELALLYQSLGRNQEALGLLNHAHALFARLRAQIELVDVSGKQQELEAAFLLVVREWGQSIESSDHYTHGHCERVAEYAVAVAQALGFDPIQQTTVRLGAYLHDVGKVRVPHEVLNKPGRLTEEEFALMKLHPIHGVELLNGVEFPWDLKPIIRWHHEKLDGTGYPDGLRGDQIPLSAQIIGIADVYDALTTTRSYRPALPRTQALAEMQRCRTWWRPEVFDAFMRTLGADLSEAELLAVA
jgi:putative nucleotidyltransferase with HDIG domain